MTRNIAKKRMLSLLLVFAVLLTLIQIGTVGAAAYESDFIDSGISYLITGSDTVQVVAAEGGYSGFVQIPALVENDGIDYAVTDIDEDAFMGSTDLTGVSIPASVTSENEYPWFINCPNLSEIAVDSGNPVYYSDSGVLFLRSPEDPDQKALFEYPAAKNNSEYAVPDGVIEIWEGAFYGSSLSSVTLPDGILGIDDNAFLGCPSLENITFVNAEPPEYIGGDIFAEDNYPIALQVPIGSESDYEDVFSDYYTDGQVTVNGQVGNIATEEDVLGGRQGDSSSNPDAPDPLKIQVLNDGSLGLFFWQKLPGSEEYGYQNQYYGDTCWGTNLFYTKGWQQYRVRSSYYEDWFEEVLPNGCISAPLGRGEQRKDGNTVTTTWQIDGGGLTLQQDITYLPGQMYYEKRWTVTNNGGEDYSDIRLIHGGDTYFGGDDSARSYWNPQTRMVYVRNEDMTQYGLLGFSGSNATPADRYFSGDYSVGGTQASLGFLEDTADESYQDGGYQLQWNRSELNAGDEWTVTSFERITEPSEVQVLAPSEQTAVPGSTVTYEFTVQNFKDTPVTYRLSASSENGWQTSISEGDSVTIDPDGGTQVVHVNVRIPADVSDADSDTITLTSTDADDSDVTSSSSTRVTVDSSLPAIKSVTSNSIVSSSASGLDVSVRTANVPDGTPITVALLNEEKEPLDPPVSASGTTTGDSTAITVPLPGDLPEGSYHISVSVDGVQAVHNSSTVTVSQDVETCTVSFESNGGGEVAPMTGVAVGGRILQPMDPVWVGHVFDGWYRDEALTEPWDFASDMVVGDLTLYAKWSETGPETHIVTFASNGGSEVAPVTVADGNTIAAPAQPTKSGYRFTGWYSNPELTDPWNFDTELVTGDTVLYAGWREKSSSGHSKPDETKTSDNTTQTKIDPASNSSTVTVKPSSVTAAGNTAEIQAAVETVAADTTGANTSIDPGRQSTVTIGLPTAEIEQQLTAKKNVDLTVTVPSSVAQHSDASMTVNINASKEILEAAKTNASDVTIHIKDADTQQITYSWTFRGEDLAKSDVPVTDVNIAMSVHLTTEVPKVNVLMPDNKGLVVSFDHSGVLPSVASVTFSALEKGFKPGETFHLYYYNPETKQIDPMGSQYTVAPDGTVTVQISHCSDYVMLPRQLRSLTLDTKNYFMPIGGKYEIGVKLLNTAGLTVKVYSSTKGVASVVKLKNGDYQVTALANGLTYIMFDFYDEEGNLIPKGHASVPLTVRKGKAEGDSSRQTAIF